MAFFRKIKAGLVKSEFEEYIGEQGQLFFNVETGELRLGDDITPGGISVGGGGGGGTYILPTASTTVKGGVKVDGTTITVNNQVISGFDGNYNSLTNRPTIPTQTNQLTNNSGFITTSSLTWTNITGKPTFSTVATSGSYTDLTNKPTIPAAYSLPTASNSVLGGIKVGTGLSIDQNGLLNATGSSSLAVSLIDSANTVSGTISNITALRFDTDSGFDITDLGSGAVKVGMNSTFKFWKVDGQNDLVATGLDTIEIVAGSGLVITTDPLSDPKSITFKAIDKTVVLYQDGVLESTVGTVRWYNPYAITVSKITARLSETSSQPVTINIRKTGTVVETLTFTTSQNKTTKTVDISMILDDYLTVDITTNGGSGLSVEFTYSFE